MSLYEVLKASKTERFPDYWTLLWGRKMSASMIKTITGVLPLTFTAKGGTAVDWVIYGNDENGTENFFGDYETFPSTHIANVNAWTSYDGGGLCQRVKCEGNTEYTLSFANTSSLFRISASSTNDVPTANNPVIVQRLVNTTNSNSETFTTPNNAKFIIVQISYDEQELLNSAMLVKGSTAPDHYIPYQQGVGERTENLFDAQAYEVGKAWNTSSNADRATVTLTVKPNTTYTVKVFETVADLVYVGVKESADATTAVASQQTVNGTVTITTTASAYTLAIQLNKTAITLNDCQNCKITLTEGSTAPTTYIPYGYQIPFIVSQQGQTDKNYDIYIGDSPLTEGETVSKTSTGVDIELFEGENTVSTTLYNKPTMEIKYK